MSEVCILNHSLLTHKITLLRDETTDVRDFRQLLHEVSTLICYEAT